MKKKIISLVLILGLAVLLYVYHISRCYNKEKIIKELIKKISLYEKKYDDQIILNTMQLSNSTEKDQLVLNYGLLPLDNSRIITIEY
jgi:hypothetical protein